jgi:ppGpp synthetase/RelA/SpoT-type nucleotidyltranferase
MSSIREEYSLRFENVLTPLATALQDHFQAVVLPGIPRIERVTARAKSINRFVAKAEKSTNGTPKYHDPLRQIQDQVGVRVIVFYLMDVEAVSEAVQRHCRHIESRRLVPESESEFGYVGQHFILATPLDAVPAGLDQGIVPEFFELQIKTLFQHAWSEANHDLGYKPASPLTADQKRRIAFSAAQAWGADRMFHELHQELAAVG